MALRITDFLTFMTGNTVKQTGFGRRIKALPAQPAPPASQGTQLQVGSQQFSTLSLNDSIEVNVILFY